MKNLSYQELKMQEYFISPNFTTEKKKLLFKWRTRAERFGEILGEDKARLCVHYV